MIAWRMKPTSHLNLLLLPLLLFGSALGLRAEGYYGPTITSLSPDWAQAGGPGFELTVTGTGFCAPISGSTGGGETYSEQSEEPNGSVVSWNYEVLPTTFVSNTVLKVNISSAQIAQDGWVWVSVQNPSRCEFSGYGYGYYFRVLPFSISSLNPPSAYVGQSNVTLAVNGQNFPSGSQIYFGGEPLTTTWVNATQVTAAIPSTYLSQPGTIHVTVAHNQSETESNHLIFTVQEPPALLITTTALPSGATGAPYSYSLTGTGGVPPHSWSLYQSSLPANLTLAPNGLISGIPAAPGTFNFAVRLSDGLGRFTLRNLSISIQSLNILTTSLPGANVRSPYSAGLSGSGGTTPYTWSVHSGSMPPGVTLNSATGVLSGAPTASGTYAFYIRLRDRAGLTVDRPFYINVAEAEIAFRILTESLPPATVGTPYSASIETTGGSGSITWAPQGTLPPGVTFAGGSLSGTPTAAGTFQWGVTARSGSSSDARGYHLTVRPAPLVITTSSPLAAGVVGQPYSAGFSATGGTPPYVWSGGGPAGLIVRTSGTLEGRPSAAGTFPFTVEVTDHTGQKVSKSFSVTIAPAVSITTASPLVDGVVNANYSAGFSAAGGTAPYTWTGNVPAGLTLNSSGQVSGRPSAAGTFGFSVQVKDANGQTASKEFSLTVFGALSITTESLPDGVAGVPYSQGVSATGGKPPYTWSGGGGALSAGPGATLSGTPAAAGALPLTVEVTDSLGNKATRSYSITILPALAITTTTVAGGTVGEAYSEQLSASGGKAPYTWSSGGSLPPNVAMNGEGQLSGTPGAAGNFSFTARVTDSAGRSSTREFTIAIQLPAAPPAVVTGLTDTTQPAQQPRFGITLGAAYPVDIAGDVVLTFRPDAPGAPDDPAVQFSTGGRTVPFTVPAGSTQASFTVPQLGVQTGTVAGVITLTLHLQASGGDITPSPAPTRTMLINRQAPVISSVQVNSTAGGFTVVISGFSTSREINNATFRFTPAAGSTLQTSEVTVPVGPVFTTWYQSPTAAGFGSQFTLTMPFTIQGSTADLASVSVVLTNAQGSSQPASANFR